MHLYVLSYLSFAAFIVYIFMGLYVYHLAPKAKLNKLFLALCLALAIWALPLSWQYICSDEGVYWQLDKAAAIGWCFLQPIYLHLVLILTKNERVLRQPRLTTVLYVPGLFLFFMEAWLFGPGTTDDQWIFIVYNFVDRFYYLSYSFIAIFLIAAWKRGSTTTIKEKKQANVITVAGIVTLGLVVPTELYFPVLIANGKAVQYSHIILLILVFGMLYAVRKYGFLSLSSLIKSDVVINKVNDIVMIVNLSGTIVNVNNRFEEILGYREDEVVGKAAAALMADFNGQIHLGDNQTIEEVLLRTKWSEEIPFFISIASIFEDEQSLVGFVLFGQDMRMVRQLKREIDERKQKEEELEFTLMHDRLTTLYNRNYFAREMDRFNQTPKIPIGIVVFDVDGLKLINDAFGNETGDEVLKSSAQIIQEVMGEKSIVARIDGDEFAAIITDFSENTIEKMEGNLHLRLQEFNKQISLVPISISLGISVNYDKNKKMEEMQKEANDRMNRMKMSRGESMRNVIVQAIMRTVEARDLVTGAHVDRLQDLAALLGQKAGLSEYQIADLKLLAQFHDIGKVGIPDYILLKPSSLTPEERSIMQNHSEIGYRIANPIHELTPISKLILLHHERWDGKGYPLEIAGEEIPIECRILAIVDAYDAMTNDRPYRKAMSSGEALLEIKRNAGSQFDPSLALQFIEIIRIKNG